MSRLKIHFDYKNEYRHAWMHIIAPMALTFLMQFIPFLLMESKQSNHTLFHVIQNESPHYLRNSMLIAILYPFIIFIRNLHNRFNALNSLLRFV